MSITRCVLVVEDENQKQCTVAVNMNNVTSPDDQNLEILRSAMKAISDGAFVKNRIAIMDAEASEEEAEEGDYESAEDRALFVFVDPSGSRYKLSVPAPLDTIFLGDKETVDPENEDVVAFIGAMETNAKGRAGGALTYVGGAKRVRNPRHKR